MQQIIIPTSSRLDYPIGREANRQSVCNKSIKFTKASGGNHVH
ncbi:hypothetical protein SAMN06296273_0513 [Nitrosomonas ureae]|uniref:Uncharacterized protein n=1 Tax=Nitrosomonas ureae TaxID=44577 RepID=A0A285BVF2_9PROT|nr:hypothetical protein SAMN06296273_0513 [Nitrosomonas ureae]